MKFIIHNSKFIIAAAALLLLVSCHKNCVCLGYDNTSYTYTADEVDARGVTHQHGLPSRTTILCRMRLGMIISLEIRI
jgi:hypothetical protein